jgi:hypothetical protein
MMAEHCSEHLAKIKPNVESGFWVFGGASLEEPFKEGEQMKANGSVMLARADTREEVLEKVKEDIYYKSGVWDADKVCVVSVARHRDAFEQTLRTIRKGHGVQHATLLCSLLSPLKTERNC